MNFSEIFWDTWKVRTSIKIQHIIENSYYQTQSKLKLLSNMSEIIYELEKSNENFDTILNRQRALIQINKALSSIENFDNTLNFNEKEDLMQEFLIIKNYLENP